MRSSPSLSDDHWVRVEATIQKAFGVALTRRAVRRATPEHDLGGLRVCVLCDQPLTTDMLLAQAEQLMAPFAGANLEDVEVSVVELLRRAAGPFNEGLDCCYACAYSRLSVVNYTVVL